MWEKKHRIRESQTKVDNEVHPLHWDMSSGPSPMGTDPINGLKMVQNGSGNNFNNCRNRMLDRNSKVFKTSSLELTTWTSKDKEAKL